MLWLLRALKIDEINKVRHFNDLREWHLGSLYVQIIYSVQYIQLGATSM